MMARINIATILDPIQLSAVQSQRCTHMIYRNKYSVHFYLPCLTFVTTSVLHLSKRKFRYYYRLENTSVVVYRPSPRGKEINQNHHLLV